MQLDKKGKREAEGREKGQLILQYTHLPPNSLLLTLIRIWSPFSFLFITRRIISLDPEREITRDLLLWSRATCHGFLLQLKLRVTYNTLCSFPHVVLMHCSHGLTSLWLLLSSFSRMRSVTSSEMWAATSRLMELMRLMISGAILCPTTFFASRKSSPISATTNCCSVSSERSCGHALMLWDTMRSELSCRNHTTHELDSMAPPSPFMHTPAHAP